MKKVELRTMEQIKYEIINSKKNLFCYKVSPEMLEIISSLSNYAKYKLVSTSIFKVLVQ